MILDWMPAFIAGATALGAVVGYFVGGWQGRRAEVRRVEELTDLLQQERLARSNALRTAGRLTEPYPDNGPPARSARIRVVGQRPGRPDKPRTSI